MRKSLFILFLLLLPFVYTSAQIYSFEDVLGVVPTVVPTGFTSTSGVLSISTTKYKLGKNSLKWDWKANDNLIATTPTGLSAASILTSGGIMLWIYNTTPNLQPLVFSFKNAAGVQKCTKSFNLNFQGWRCFNATFASDMGHDKTALSSMTIQAPSSGTGTIYLDYLEFKTTVDWSRISDAQYSVVPSTLMSDFLTAYNKVLTPVINPSSIDLTGADAVTLRMDNWHLGSGAFSSAAEIISRKNSNASWTGKATTYYTGLNLTAQPDGTVLGPGLFSLQFPSIIDGVAITQFKALNSAGLIPLAIDYRLNGTSASKNTLVNIYDYFNDQGWAGGSALSSLYFENISNSVGYFHSLYLMRNALDATRLQRELNTVKWFSLFGETISPMVVLSQRGVDNMRSILTAKFIYALMQTDPQSKVAALYALRDYCNQVFLPSPGFWDNFKSDYSGYAHGSPYIASYYGDALYMACFSYYLLHGTPYALSDGVFQQLKNSLLTYRNLASYYCLPMSMNGRFPIAPDFGKQIIPAFAYLALSQATPDTELLAAFGRLWQPVTNYALKSHIGRVATDITYKSAVGETELCSTAAALAVPAEPSPRKQLFLPYSGLLVSRDAVNHVSVKGFSKYIWDYESGLPSDNLYGRYLSYGHIEYTSLADGRKNDAADDPSWDWNRIPGTTVEHLDSTSLVYTSATSYRNFSDIPHLGGIAMNDSTSMISMRLHDNTFDKTFYANKSVFCFGNVLVCLGTGIKNSATTSQTETTLFQQGFIAGESVLVNNATCTTSQAGFVSPLIQDNLGNRFIVKDGTVDMVQKGALFTAYINHGMAPVNKSYEYYMLMKSNTSQVSKYSNGATNPIEIVRKDTVAHIVKQKEQNVIAYSIFNIATTLNDSYVKQVNSPSMVMIQKLSQGAITLTVSDPDMRRLTGISLDKLSAAAISDPGTAFNYQITLNGFYTLSGVNTGVTLTYGTSNTVITISVSEGKSYSVNLTPLVSSQNFYVDPVAGVDTNTGQSWQTALKTISKAYTLAQVKPGFDNIFVKGGCTIAYPTSTLTLPGENFYGGFQGTESTPNQRPLMDLDGNGIVEPWEFQYSTIISSTFVGNALIMGPSNFNGFTISHTVTSTTAAMATITCDPNGVFENNIVKNCTLTLSTGTNTLAGILVRGQGLIQNCLFEKNKVTVNVNSSNDKPFVPIMDAIAGVKVNGCVFRNNNAVVDATATTAGLTTSAKGMILNVTGNSTPTTVSTITNCLVYNNEATYTGGGGTSTATMTGGSILGTNGLSTTSSVDSILNCTVANNKVTGLPCAGLSVAKTGSLVHVVVNNNFWNNQSGGVVKNLLINSAVSTGRIGYNIMNSGNNGTYTVAGITTDNIFDLANTNTGILNLPNFVRPTLLIGCATDGSVEIANWKPLSGSYLLGKGVLTTRNYDKSGTVFLTPRAIGAYEYMAPIVTDEPSMENTSTNFFSYSPGGLVMQCSCVVEIYDLSGIRLKKMKLTVGDFIMLPKGVYIVKACTNSAVSVQKIVL